ncbi:hypothetical protein ACQ4PT_022260 [Festuca glaucescens]
MHLFLKPYMRLQLSRDADENYEEKRTELGGMVVRHNLDIERHASKIYTQAMFEQFGQSIYKGFAFRVIGYKEEFDCECGLFAHMGILCGHALKVMDYVGVTQIPSKHILKRWTRDARDILPEHLRHYQKDESHGKAVTYRHSNLYILAMELVRLGDASSEAYEKLCDPFQGKPSSHGTV